MVNLSKEESEQYIKIVKEGNYDDMFDFAYAIGWKKAVENTNGDIVNVMRNLESDSNLFHQHRIF